MCVLFLGLSSARYSEAEGGTKAKADAHAQPYRRLSDRAHALPQLGGEVASLNLGEPSLVAVTSIAVPEELRQLINAAALETLRSEIRKNVASTVPLAKIQTEEALSAPAARTRARRAGLPLVLLAPTIKAGDLFLDVTVTKWPSNFWRRSLAPEGTTTEALHLRVRADFLRELFPVAKTLTRKRSAIKSPISAPVALACGDIDEDGHPDLAVVGRNAVVLGTLDSDSFRERARRTWEGLSPVHSAPLRSPLAAARIEDKLLTVGLSDRAQTIHLNERLETVGYSARGYPLPGGQCLPYSPAGAVQRAFDCKTPQKVPPAPSVPAAEVGEHVLDAYASSWFLAKSGASGSITTSLPLGNSDASVEVAFPSEQVIQLALKDTGSALVSADLNGDGMVEIISSSDSAPGATDQLRIHRHVDKKLVKSVEIQTDSIAALAVCPFAGENPLTIVMATREELWILK